MSGAAKGVPFESALSVATFSPYLWVAALALLGCAPSEATGPARQSEPGRIAVAGRAAGELVAALGLAHAVVAADLSALDGLGDGVDVPTIGYVRSLPVEGLLSVQPDMLFATAEAGPPEALAQLESLLPQVFLLPAGNGVEGALARVRAAGRALGRSQAAEALAARVEAESQVAQARAREHARPRVLWVLSPGGGAPMVAGRDTPAHSLLAEAGAENAAAELAGWKALSREVLWSLSFDALVVSAPGLPVGPLSGADLARIWPQEAMLRGGREWPAVHLGGGALAGGPAHGLALQALVCFLERVPVGGGEGEGGGAR